MRALGVRQPQEQAGPCPAPRPVRCVPQETELPRPYPNEIPHNEKLLSLKYEVCGLLFLPHLPLVLSLSARAKSHAASMLQAPFDTNQHLPLLN